VSGLRELAEQATQYRTGQRAFDMTAEGIAALHYRADVLRVADAKIAALAPGLAVWAADARDALDMCHTGMANIVCSRGGIGCSVDHDYLAPLLARFDKIEQEGAS
jgi:hypothetical protein